MELFWQTTGTIKKGYGFSHFDHIHLLWLAAFLVIAVACSLVYKKCSEKGRRNMRYIFAALLLADELFKIIGLVTHGNYNPNYLPLHLCSINIILITLHAIKPNRVLGSVSLCHRHSRNLDGARISVLDEAPVFEFYASA